MAYSVLLILAAAYPRRRDHFLEDQPLKLHIIKTCAEWTIGIQPRDLNESHWIVKGESNGDRKHGVLPKAKTVPKHNARVSNCITQRLFWPSRAALVNEVRSVIAFDGNYVNYRHLAILVDI